MSSTAAQMESGTAKSGGGAAAPKSKKNLYIGLILVAALGGGIAGGLVGGLSQQGGLVLGTWKGNWGSYVTVTPTHWYSKSSWGASVYAIETLGNSQCIMQNPADDAYNPSKWTKNEYHAIEDGFASCSSVYNGETAAAARDTDTTTDVDGNGSVDYNSEDATAGCNGFSHSTYTAYAMPIAGKWTDNWGVELEITATEWKTTSGDPKVTTSYPIEAYGADFVLYQNPADAAYNPSKWVLTEFHMIGNDFGYCMSVFNGATAAAALGGGGLAAGYNASDATGGCNGFGHSIASPVAA